MQKRVAEMLLAIVVACTVHFLFSPAGFVVEGDFHCRVIPNSSENIAVIFLVVFTQAWDWGCVCKSWIVYLGRVMEPVLALSCSFSLMVVLD